MSALAPADLPGWPRGLSETLAAAYCGISPATLRRLAAEGDAPKPVHLSAHRVAWLRDDLDRWLDAKAGRAPALQETDPWMTR